MADIVDDFLTRLAQLAPDLPKSTLQTLEIQSRQAWGGTEPYVGKRPTMRHTVKIGEALRAAKPLSSAFTEAGIRRSQGYALLARKIR
jgi:hypothetical protein